MTRYEERAAPRRSPRSPRSPRGRRSGGGRRAPRAGRGMHGSHRGTPACGRRRSILRSRSRPPARARVPSSRGGRLRARPPPCGIRCVRPDGRAPRGRERARYSFDLLGDPLREQLHAVRRIHGAEDLDAGITQLRRDPSHGGRVGHLVGDQDPSRAEAIITRACATVAAVIPHAPASSWRRQSWAPSWSSREAPARRHGPRSSPPSRRCCGRAPTP